MLQIRRLELQGFKSFVERTELRFAGTGFTAVVGPNGCGKSNLADAISWVLGEQSAKSLRGSRMEDVIFAGTRDRKPVGMATVTLTLVDPRPDADPGVDGAGNGHSSYGHPATPKEITVSRRLYRSGESDYLIDGRHTRLRDIQDIFMGTGLGPESYAIIEQGRITQILSTKPQERRAVIEEAAGVSKFKTRRRLAEAKLEGAKQNLSRVFDILEEVSRQTNSLKRQASKARRYEELKTEMLGHLSRALAGRFKIREREAAKTALDLNEATREFQQLSSDVQEKESLQASLQEQCFALEGDLTGKRQELSELRVESERAKGRLETQAGQIAAIESRLAQGETETEELEARLERLRADCQAHADALAGLNAAYDDASRRLEEKTVERDQRQAELRQREMTLEAGRQQVLKLLGESSTLQNQLAQNSEYLSSVERETARAQREEQAAAADLDRLSHLKRQLSERVASRQLELTSVTDQRRAVEEELHLHKTRAAEVRHLLETLRADFSRIKARKDSTQDVLSHRSYTTESVKRLFTAIEHGQARELQPLGVLADFLEVDAAWEKAAEEFLHDELEYVVVRDWSDAHRGVDLMRGDLDGRATFLVHPEQDLNPAGTRREEPAVGPETGILGRLGSQLRMTNGLTQAPVELIPRLARCFLVGDRGAAQRLALEYPDFFFLLPDGVSYHGHAVSGGKKTGSGPLALKRELRELAVLIAAKQAQVDESAKALEQAEREIDALTEDLERLRAVQQLQEKDALALDHEMRKLSEELNRTNQRLSVVRLELQRLAREAQTARERQAATGRDLEQTEFLRAHQEQALEAARSELTELQQVHARLAEEHAALRAGLAALEERRRAEENARALLEQQIGDFGSRLEDLLGEIGRFGIDRARLLDDNMEVDARINELNRRISALEETVLALEEKEARSRSSLTQAEEELRGLRTAVSAAQENRSQIEVQLVRLQSELQYLDETCRKELSCPLEELSQDEETVPDEMELAEAEARYEEVKTRIDNLGPVNPQALEEYQEAQQRYDFLNAQRQDLLDSIRDTEKAIQEIDVESRRRFHDAFEAINANFREMFKVLFHGGIGEMRLTDPENQADSGVDIMASPPGKKLQNVLLLSGGERSLTAMALLLAIFQYTPSPFCVLDEVDAALDEANITRLVKLLKEMSRQTQFIIITHAKRTMEASESLYGVTMQEPGVSKIVSVRFQEPEAALPAPPQAPQHIYAASAD
ncbi:MAG: chromosome segregation protein SMC [Acidobacteria bacterium]|nr:chromosome segregation protein SMC [Acidobacteriota bacterium]